MSWYAEAADLYRAGQTLAAIGTRFGVSRQRVSQVLHKQGIRPEVRWRQQHQPPGGPCAVADCPKPSAQRGLCHMHYERVRRSGTTDAPPPRDPPPHGTVTRYRSARWRCRCDPCRAAMSAYKIAWYHQPPPTDRTPPPHGTLARYGPPWKCRDAACRAANTAVCRQQRIARRAR